MNNQSVNPSVPFATQLRIFAKGQVSVSPNPFSFSKHRDGIGLELAKFFAHGFAIITGNNCKNPCPAGATVRPYYSRVSPFIHSPVVVHHVERPPIVCRLRHGRTPYTTASGNPAQPVGTVLYDVIERLQKFRKKYNVSTSSRFLLVLLGGAI